MVDRKEEHCKNYATTLQEGGGRKASYHKIVQRKIMYSPGLLRFKILQASARRESDCQKAVAVTSTLIIMRPVVYNRMHREAG